NALSRASDSRAWRNLIFSAGSLLAQGHLPRYDRDALHTRGAISRRALAMDRRPEHGSGAHVSTNITGARSQPPQGLRQYNGFAPSPPDSTDETSSGHSGATDSVRGNDRVPLRSGNTDGCLTFFGRLNALPADCKWVRMRRRIEWRVMSGTIVAAF